jgi:hypothetical protein
MIAPDAQPVVSPKNPAPTNRPRTRWAWPWTAIAYAVPMACALAAWRSPQAALAPLFGPWAKVLYRGDPWIWAPGAGPWVVASTVLGPLVLGLALWRRSRGTLVVLATWWTVWVFLMLCVLLYTLE